MGAFDLSLAQDVIGYRFTNADLLTQALTHASAAPTRAASNERLEFLGDAVLGLVVCLEIFSENPDLAEGEMTKIKSSVVSRATCARVATQTGLAPLLVLGKGLGAGDELPPSLAAAVYEALIGAIFLDGGYEAARTFILRTVREPLAEATACQHQRNFKSLLQQHAQRQWNVTPTYDVLDEKGPEHAKCFEVVARLPGRQFPSAWGASKKDAEQKAARVALEDLGVLSQDGRIDEESF